MSRVECANTRRSYDAATRHFEIDWGEHLPTTADSVARYLADYSGALTLNTLKHHFAALATARCFHGVRSSRGGRPEAVLTSFSPAASPRRATL